MSKMEPFSISHEDYNFWINNPTLELFIDLTQAPQISQVHIHETKDYLTLDHTHFKFKAKKYATLSQRYLILPTKFSFDYFYKKNTAFHIEITQTNITISPDETSCFPAWYAYSQGKIALAQTYGDLLRLCKKHELQLTYKYKTQSEFENLLDKEEVIFNEIAPLIPDFQLNISAKSCNLQKLQLEIDGLQEIETMDTALKFFIESYKDIESYFDTNGMNIGTALSGGKDSTIISALTKRQFPSSNIIAYSQINDPTDQKAAIETLTQHYLKLPNKITTLDSSGLALIDPLDPYLNPYGKANMDFAELISKDANTFFNGFGGDEVLKSKTLMQEIVVENEVDEREFLDRPYIHTSIIKAHQATSPFYLRHGVVPFSPLCIRRLYLGILLIDEELKKENMLYKQILQMLHLPYIQETMESTESLSVFFAQEFGRIHPEFANITTKKTYKDNKKALLKSHRLWLQKLSTGWYNGKYGTSSARQTS